MCFLDSNSKSPMQQWLAKPDDDNWVYDYNGLLLRLHQELKQIMADSKPWISSPGTAGKISYLMEILVKPCLLSPCLIAELNN